MKANAKPDALKVPLRVLIANGSPASSEGLAAMLADQECIQVVGCANKAIQALGLVESVQPDVVLLDLQMPGDSLVSVLHLIKRATPVPAVMVLTPYPSGVLRRRCLDAGADYVFTNSTDFERINGALQALLAAKQSCRPD